MLRYAAMFLVVGLGATAWAAAAGPLRHVADRAGHAGRVELWPLVPAPELPEPAPWSVPERNQASVGAMQRLADALADAAPRTGHAGICALSSRADTESGLFIDDHGDATGGLVLALFGTPGHTVSSVRPLKGQELLDLGELGFQLRGLTGPQPSGKA
jgi:hypothetical protein